jgi:hypothetical protein
MKKKEKIDFKQMAAALGAARLRFIEQEYAREIEADPELAEAFAAIRQLAEESEHDAVKPK